MRPLPVTVLLSALALAACQTPREACISDASRQLRIVDSLIRETQGNLARGYGIEEDQEVRVERDFCRVEREDGSTGLARCERTVVDDIERPVALDLREEQAKLDSLLERRQTLLSQTAAAQQSCVATYPE